MVFGVLIQEINMITKLTYSWTLDDAKVRLALVGAYLGNEFNGLDYFTDRFVLLHMSKTN